MLPEGHDADKYRAFALETFNIAYGASFGAYAGKYFRIGHLADINDGTLLGALAITEKSLGPEHPDTGARLNDLGELYEAMGLYAEALPRYRRGLIIMEKALGPAHPDTGAQLSSLGDLYRTMGQYGDALRFARVSGRRGAVRDLSRCR